MNIHCFPITAEHALSLIRQIADCGNALIPDPPTGGDWYRLVSRRQVDCCLKEGDCIGEPEIDEHGNVRCILERFGAGLAVRVHVALEKHQDLWRIIVVEVENRL